MEVRRPIVTGFALVLVGILSVQLGAAIAKSIFDLAAPLALVGLRLALSGLIIVLIIRPRVRGWTWPTWRSVIALGLIIAVMNTTFYLAFERIPLGVAVALELLGPLTVAALGTRRLLDAVWVILAFAGVCLIGLHSLGGALDPVGVVLALGAGVCWGLYIFASREVGQRVDGAAGIAVALGVAGVAGLPLGLLPAIDAVTVNPQVLLIGLAVAVLSSVVPYAAEFVALRSVPTNVFGVLMSLEPAAGALAALVILGETLDVIELTAVALVIAASAGVAASASAAAPKRAA